MALSQAQIAQLWVRQGGDPKYANVMSRIALRESGGRPGINNRGTNSNGTTDWGLFQVNDVWRKDPVIGPMFRSGAILTPQGATRAAIHILKVQGPKAWATYNPATDAKYIGQMPGGAGAASGAGQVVRKSSSPATPSVAPDQSAQRAALISQYLSTEHQPGALTGLASGLLGLSASASSPAATVKVAKSPRVTVQQMSGTSQGVASFDGKQVAAWMVPALQYARAHGWNGSIISGVRTRSQQAQLYATYKNSGFNHAHIAAKPGQSNHEIQNGGAVDVTDPQSLNNVLKGFKGRKPVWGGPVIGDYPHFSSNGH